MLEDGPTLAATGKKLLINGVALTLLPGETVEVVLVALGVTLTVADAGDMGVAVGVADIEEDDTNGESER